MRQLILFSYLMLHLSTLMAAEPIDIGSMTDSEIEELSESEKARIPVFDLLARPSKDETGSNEKRKAIIAGLEMMLYDLRYYSRWPTGETSPSLTKAIADFQADLDHESTGIFLMGEFEELGERYDYFEHESLRLSDYSAVLIFGDYATVTGTWIFADGSKMANAIQTSEISCDKNQRVCREAVADVLLNTLNVSTSEMRVTKWTKTEIVAEDDTARCVSYTLSINIPSKKATKFRRNKGGDDCRDYAQTPQVLELVKGSDVALEISESKERGRLDAFNSSYKKVLEPFLGVL